MERALPIIIHSTTSETLDISLDRLLSPSRFFAHPDDVVADPTLDIQEKRAILASWASDASAIESVPALRALPGSEIAVSFDEVMEALQRLDAVSIREPARCNEHGGTLPHQCTPQPHARSTALRRILERLHSRDKSAAHGEPSQYCSRRE
ncbi:hypothetical protein [Mesorhizobium retamae]|uniref:hypothetical protein n=1 Tax=Mesorhizobium retamae TaxID=2912854 RepID=UPI003CCFE92C